MFDYLNFNSRTTYILCVREWSRDYQLHVKRIQEAKMAIRNDARAGKFPDYYALIRARKEMIMHQVKRDNMRVEAHQQWVKSRAG